MTGPVTDAAASSLAQAVGAGERRALARLITQIENGHPAATPALQQLHAKSGRAQVIGITGPPGTGKSSLVNELALELRRRELTVGIIAVDPSSPFSGGAILGDRVRMGSLAADPGVFMRSMASRGALGGLAASSQEAIVAMDAFGVDRIIVETVGVGQAEVGIAGAADTTVVVGMPGMGDDVQAIKAGILEIADLFVINKADQGRADELARQLTIALRHPEPGGWLTPILKTVATQPQGVLELADALAQHWNWLQGGEHLAKRRRLRYAAYVADLVQRGLRQRLDAGRDGELETMLDDIVGRRIDPHTAAQRLLREGT